MFNSKGDRKSQRPCDVDDSYLLSSPDLHVVEVKTSKSLKRNLNTNPCLTNAHSSSSSSFNRDKASHTSKTTTSSPPCTTFALPHLSHKDSRETGPVEESTTTVIDTTKTPQVPLKNLCHPVRDNERGHLTVEELNDGDGEKFCSSSLLLLDSAADLFNLVGTSSSRKLLTELRRTKHQTWTTSSKCSGQITQHEGFSGSLENAPQEGEATLTSNHRIISTPSVVDVEQEDFPLLLQTSIDSMRFASCSEWMDHTMERSHGDANNTALASVSSPICQNTTRNRRNTHHYCYRHHHHYHQIHDHNPCVEEQSKNYRKAYLGWLLYRSKSPFSFLTKGWRCTSSPYQSSSSSSSSSVRVGVDNHSKTVHQGIRDCSVYQKISSFLGPRLSSSLSSSFVYQKMLTNAFEEEKMESMLSVDGMNQQMIMMMMGMKSTNVYDHLSVQVSGLTASPSLGNASAFHTAAGESSSSGCIRALIGSPDATTTTMTPRSGVQLITSPSSQERTYVGSSDRPTSSVNDYGFFTNERPYGDLPPVTNYPELTRHVESKRNEKWRRMLGDNAEDQWSLVCHHDAKLFKRRVRKGIPRDWRYRLWPLLTGGRQLFDRHPGEYQRLLRLPSDHENEISIDIHRTLPNHVFFSDSGRAGGQQSLFRILKAYSIYDQEVGYAQGMGGIVAVLLVVMEEESAFWTFVAMMSEEVDAPRPSTAGPPIQCRNLFLEGVPLAHEMMSKMKHLLHEKLPNVAKKLTEGDILPSQYGTKWWMSLFCFVLPFQHVVRVWDVLFLEGWKMALRTCLAIMKALESTVLRQPVEQVGIIFANPNQIAEHLPPPDAFMKMVLGVKISKSLSRWTERDERA